VPSYHREVKLPGKSSQELYDKVASDIDRFLQKASIGKFDVERDPSKKEVRVKSSMFSATLVCSDGTLKLDCQLSLLATPFRSKIDEGIDKWIAKAFNQAQTPQA
jgi:hypothetical protein